MSTGARKPRALKAHITRLEMTAPPRQSLPLPVNIGAAVMRVPDIPLAYYRFLYDQVGHRWHWVDRLRLDDEALRSILHDKRTEIAVLYVNGAPAGFYEFFRHDGDFVEFCHFGLMEHALGLGVGDVDAQLGFQRHDHFQVVEAIRPEVDLERCSRRHPLERHLKLPCDQAANSARRGHAASFSAISPATWSRTSGSLSAGTVVRFG